MTPRVESDTLYAMRSQSTIGMLEHQCMASSAVAGAPCITSEELLIPSPEQPNDRWAPVNILGVDVAPWDADALIAAMIRSATERTRPGERPLSTVHYANIHVLNTAFRHPPLRDQLVQGTVYCDGSGVRLGAALLGQRLPPRLTAADWIDDFCDRAARRDVSLFLVGGADGVADRASVALRQRHPELRIAGTHHGFLDGEASGRVIAELNRARAGVVLVGMGTPVQELWVAEHRQEIEAPVVWTVGALFDFVAGAQRLAPRWLGDRHLEWLWRLASHPRRLARRYMLGNALFCLRVARQRVTTSLD